MNILYIGQLQPGGTCRDRMLALEALDFAVECFDTTPYLRSGLRPLRSLAHRFNIGPSVRRLNADLAALPGSSSTSRMVWVDKGKWIYPETLAALRRAFGGPLIHYTPDAQFKDNRSRHFHRSVPLYDVLVTTKPFEVGHYRDAGAERVLLTGQAYDELRARKAQYRTCLTSDVCFIGHCQPHYEHLAAQVDEEEVDFKVWGPGWPQTPYGFVEGSGLWSDDYYDGLKSARIGLGFLSKRIPEVSTTRSFEIPASETLLLAERTEEHRRYFKEGSEAEFFADTVEMRSKIRFYLRNERARERISEAGRRKCERAGYGNRCRLRSVMKAITGSKAFADLRFHQ